MFSGTVFITLTVVAVIASIVYVAWNPERRSQVVSLFRRRAVSVQYSRVRDNMTFFRFIALRQQLKFVDFFLLFRFFILIHVFNVTNRKFDVGYLSWNFHPLYFRNLMSDFKNGNCRLHFCIIVLYKPCCSRSRSHSIHCVCFLFMVFYCWRRFLLPVFFSFKYIWMNIF